MDTTSTMKAAEEKVDAEQASMIWQKLCAVNQRLLLARAVDNKLISSIVGYPDEQKHKYLKSLRDEVVMLNFIKCQLEEAVVRYFANEISFNDADPPTSLPLAGLPNTNSAFPLSHLQTPLTESTSVLETSNASEKKEEK